MTDIVDAATRSRMMSGIRSRNTRPELLVRRLLHRMGFRFRLHVRTLPGTPDLVLARYHAVIFVHGCFWHGHACPLFRLPATRTDFWRDKISRNQKNDRKNRDALRASGWRVATVWECALRGRAADPERAVNQLSGWLKGLAPVLELSGVQSN